MTTTRPCVPTLIQARPDREWDFTVPADDAELLAELRRHGVRPGVRVHFATSVAGAGSDEPPRSSGSDDASDRENSQVQTNKKSRRRHLSFAGSTDAESDLAEHVDEHVRGFGSERSRSAQNILVAIANRRDNHHQSAVELEIASGPLLVAPTVIAEV